MTRQLILASASASRRAMLEGAGVDFVARPVHADEAALKTAMAGAHPRDIADALAQMKALKASLADPAALCLGVDSIVVVDGKIYDKPTSRDDAAAHLAAFSGQVMTLISAIVACEGGAPIWRHIGIAKLYVRPLDPAEIQTYLDAEWPAISGCVGCFRIEGRGVNLFDKIEGDYFTILGMPLLPLLRWLRVQAMVP